MDFSMIFSVLVANATEAAVGMAGAVALVTTSFTVKKFRRVRARQRIIRKRTELPVSFRTAARMFHPGK